MSFASNVKEEITRLEVDDNVRKAELSALLKLTSTLGLSSKGMHLTVAIKNAAVIRFVAQSLQVLYGVRAELQAVKDNRFEKTNTYHLVINEQVREILEDLDLWTGTGLQTHPRMRFLGSDEKMRGYIMGCFLAKGSINSPASTNYHAEIVSEEEEHAVFVCKLLEKFFIDSKVTTRRNQYVTYIKASEQVSDFLRLIGASEAVFEFEDVRIQRDFVNSISRLNNCTIANDAKSLEMAHRQYEAVDFLTASGNIAKLSGKDQEIAYLRLENPDAGLLELAELYSARTGTVLSKSGIRHRFVKIMDLADKYQNKEAK